MWRLSIDRRAAVHENHTTSNPKEKAPHALTLPTPSFCACNGPRTKFNSRLAAKSHATRHRPKFVSQIQTLRESHICLGAQGWIEPIDVTKIGAAAGGVSDECGEASIRSVPLTQRARRSRKRGRPPTDGRLILVAGRSACTCPPARVWLNEGCQRFLVRCPMRGLLPPARAAVAAVVGWMRSRATTEVATTHTTTPPLHLKRPSTSALCRHAHQAQPNQPCSAAGPKLGVHPSNDSPD